MKYRITVFALLALLASEAMSGMATEYANAIKRQLKPNAVCANYASMIDRIANGGYPDAVKVRQIDKVVDSASRTGCIEY